MFAFLGWPFNLTDALLAPHCTSRRRQLRQAGTKAEAAAMAAASKASLPQPPPQKKKWKYLQARSGLSAAGCLMQNFAALALLLLPRFA